MNTNNNDGLIYKIAAIAIFVVCAVLVILLIAGNSSAPPTEPPQNPVSPSEAPETNPTNPLFPSITPSSDSVAEPDTPSAPSTSPITVQPDSIVTDTTAEVTVPATAHPTVSAPVSQTPEEWASFLSEYPDTVLPISEDAGQEYIDKLTFLGDSTTYGLRAYKMLSGGRDTKQVWTPESGTLTLYQASFVKVVYPDTGEQLTIKEAVTQKQPEYLVITLGVNGVASMDEDYFKSEYKNVIKTVTEASPDTKIICQSIFPVARTYDKLDKINNEKIMAANRWIVEIAQELGVKFVDTYSVLCDSEGWLPEEYHNGDGMHLNSTSFTLELNNLRTHAFTE